MRRIDTSRRRRRTFRRRRRRMLPGVLAVALVAGTGGYFMLRGDAPTDDSEEKLVEAQPVCEIDPDILQAVSNGYVPGRSGDVLAIEQPPNQFGTRHSSPHPLHQDVPLLLYGPGFIRPGEITTDATVADLSPTFAELLGFDAYPTAERDGKVLEEALLGEEQRNGVPKLIVTLVWDGGGDNVLERWPDAWPELAELMSKSAVYPNATVGSSPSITPAIHANIGAGTFPQIHGLPDTRIRVRGKMVDAWEGSSPRYLRVKTLGDLWDAANDNVPLVGMMARDAWHLGMIGHGAYLPEGDHDIAVMDQLGAVNFRTNPDYYSMPDYVNLEGLEDAVATVDQRDGELDGRWLGNPLLPYDGGVRATPAWSLFQTQKLLELLGNEGFGADDVPDLFYVNYKAIDLAGHTWNMVDPEVEENVIESDAQLPPILDWLDDNVGKNNYVLAFTADHGMTPTPSVTKGWGIEVSDMTRDLERRFDHKTPNVPLVLSNRGYQIMLNANELKRNDVTAEDVAEWVRDYRIRDNVTKTNTVLPRFRGRTDQRLYLTALTPDELADALRCAREERDDQARARRDLDASLAARTKKSGLPNR